MQFSLQDENKTVCVLFTCPALSLAHAATCSEGLYDIITNCRRIRAIKENDHAIYYICRALLAKGEAHEVILRLK